MKIYLKVVKKTTGAAKNLHGYIKKKKAFIQNQAASGTTYDNLKAEEKAVFLDLISEMIIEKEQQIQKRKVSQGSMFGGATQTDLFAEQTFQLKAEIEQLKAVRQQIHKQKRLPFSYDIDFMEVFVAKEDDADKGFDLVIGNPPYVRQEQILPPEDPVYLEKLMKPQNKALKAKVNKEYKALLNDRVYKVYPWLGSTMLTTVDGKNKAVSIYGQKVPGRADLYMYFQLLCPHYLNSKGTFCFIISNSWMDVDFGSYIQHFMLKHTKLIAVYDCNMRSFEAAVNTVIYLHGSITNLPVLRSNKYSFVQPLDNTARFIMNKVDFDSAAYSKLLIEQESKIVNTFETSYRVIPLDQLTLYVNGFEEQSKSFEGDKWGGKYLRAPEIYYKILMKGINDLVELKSVSDVIYGIKTGANDFFIVDDEIINAWGIENEFLEPILKSPKESKLLKINAKNLNLKLLLCDKPIKELRGKNIKKYIEYGEDPDQWEGNPPAMRSSCTGRANWYTLGNRKKSSINCNYMVNTLMKFYFGDVFVSDNFQEVHYKGNNLDEFIFSCNSTIFQLILNVMGRANFGDGLMKLQTFEVQRLLLTAPDKFKFNIEEKKLLKAFLGRNHDSIFNEIGLNEDIPIRSQHPKPLPDRAALDKIIFDVIGLTEDERKEVYWSVAELVQQRLNKAASR